MGGCIHTRHTQCHVCSRTYHGTDVLDVADVLGQVPHGHGLAVQPLIILGVVPGRAHLFFGPRRRRGGRRVGGGGGG